QQDLNINSQENSFPVTIISEGKIIKESFKQIKASKEKILDFLHTKKLNIKNILIFTLDNNGVIYLQEKYKKGKTFLSELKG
ncbi:MAG: hypothetical protein J6Q51_02095, partial [Clostridia bacterium]|nr:hypothetical protein [Clostridia bacterium]